MRCREEAIRTGFLLSQGGEFAFVLLSLAKELKVLPDELNRLLIIVVVLSMALTPFLTELGKTVADASAAKNPQGHGHGASRKPPRTVLVPHLHAFCRPAGPSCLSDADQCIMREDAFAGDMTSDATSAMLRTTESGGDQRPIVICGCGRFLYSAACTGRGCDAAVSLIAMPQQTTEHEAFMRGQVRRAGADGGEHARVATCRVSPEQSSAVHWF